MKSHIAGASCKFSNVRNTQTSEKCRQKKSKTKEIGSEMIPKLYHKPCRLSAGKEIKLWRV